MAKGARGTKIGFVGLLIGTYFIYTIAIRPIYNRLIRPFPPNAVVFRNAVSPGDRLALELSVESRAKTFPILNNTEIGYSNTRIAAKANIQTVIGGTLRARLRFRNRCTQREDVVECRLPLSQQLPELRAKSKGAVDGVRERGTVGPIQEHTLTRAHIGLVLDDSPRVFGVDAYTDAVYASTNTARSLSSDGGCYRPALLCSPYWTLRRDKVPTTKLGDAEFHAEFYTTGEYRAEWAAHFELMERGSGGALDTGPILEDFKEMLSDNSSAYLALLFVVNALHTLFFALSLSSSYSFWSTLNSSAGLSAQKYYADLLFQFITLLYMIDNETSLLLVLLAVVELAMNVYIAARVTGLSVRVLPRFPFLRVSAPARHSATAEYERTAVRFLAKLAVPILLAYTAYSYTRRDGLRLYSFVVKTLAMAVYVFGFINMTPQVYINYRLKSVESMPWRAMTFQFLNTIVDDLAAFAVKMPPLQRLAVFRDDVIFCIYLGQRWLYRGNHRKAHLSVND